MPIDSIDSLKRRMIKNASKIWGYPDVQDINLFDPVLGLLFGALAEELYNISNEINDADARVVEKLLDVLFSRNMFTHFPAHAIACAKPFQPQVTINGNYQFYYLKEFHKKDNRDGSSSRKNIWFTPLNTYKLLNGEVKYLFAEKFLYEIGGRQKEIIAERPGKIPEATTKLFLGVWLDAQVELLDGLSLCFLFKNIVESDRFYHALHKARWKLNGQEVSFQSGLDPTSASFGSLKELLKNESSLSYRTARFINDFYNKHFLTLPNGNYLKKDFLREGYEPQYLTDSFKGQKMNIFDNDIIWLEADFFQSVSLEEINDLVISMNCFPVINREFNEYTHSLVKGTNIIPLLTDDFFHEVFRVSDSKDKTFLPQSSFKGERESEKSYLIRQGGIARFDSRDARKTISHLIDVVRDEAAAFSMRGAELISSELKQLDQILSRLQQRIDTSGIINDLISYLVIRSNIDYDRINVQYWSVAGEQANNIRPDSKLLVYRGADLDDKRISLFTPTVGGRHKLSNEDKLNLLRRSLLSKGRVVTAEDIKALCFEVFGGYLVSADVTKGVMCENAPGKGMSRTLDIHLILNKEEDPPEEEVYHRIESLKVRLKEESVNLLPYRVFIK